MNDTASNQTGLTPPCVTRDLFWFGVIAGPVLGSIAGFIVLLFFLIYLGNDNPFGFPRSLLQFVVFPLGLSLLALPGTFWAMRAYKNSVLLEQTELTLANSMRVGFKSATYFAVTVLLMSTCYVVVMSWSDVGVFVGTWDALLKLAGGFLILGVAFLIAWTPACVGVLFAVPICWWLAKKLKLVSIEN